MKALDLEQVLSMREKVRENARQLLCESELLLASNHHSRAYALAQLSIEELGKLPMLNTVSMRLVSGHPVDWKKLDRRLRGHEDKTKLIHLMEGMISAFPDEIEDRKNIETMRNFLTEFVKSINMSLQLRNGVVPSEYQRAFKSSQKINEKKNLSLYTDVARNGDALLPSERITAEQAADRVAKAGFYLKKMDSMEPQMITGIKNDAKEGREYHDHSRLLDEIVYYPQKRNSLRLFALRVSRIVTGILGLVRKGRKVQTLDQ